MKLKNEYGSVAVYTRSHIGNCKFTETEQNACSCPKWLYVNRRGEGFKPERSAVGTPSYAEACRTAQNLLESWNPVHAENQRLKAAKERTEVTVEKAVMDFLASCEERFGGKNGTYCSYVGVLGSADAAGKRGSSPLVLLNWLAKYNSSRESEKKITYISQLTTPVLEEWRLSWKKLAMSTRRQRWTTARVFFAWLHGRGTVERNHALGVAKLGRRDTATGTGVLTDKQWQAFEDAMKSEPLEVRGYFQLMRWAGMAVCDAAQFDKAASLDGHVVKYWRHKLKSKGAGYARVPLLPHVAELLRALPNKPFWLDGRAMSTNTDRWRVKFHQICERAGIKEVATGKGGSQRPHPHCLRDTFAVWALRHCKNVKVVSVMLGHSNSIMTEQAYLPWCKELEDMADSIYGAALASVPASGTVPEQRVTIQ